MIIFLCSIAYALFCPSLDVLALAKYKGCFKELLYAGDKKVRVTIVHEALQTEYELSLGINSLRLTYDLSLKILQHT